MALELGNLALQVIGIGKTGCGLRRSKKGGCCDQPEKLILTFALLCPYFLSLFPYRFSPFGSRIYRLVSKKLSRISISLFQSRKTRLVLPPSSLPPTRRSPLPLHVSLYKSCELILANIYNRFNCAMPCCALRPLFDCVWVNHLLPICGSL